MKHPEFDSDGYPTDNTLNIITSWQGDWEALMNYIQEAWRYKNYFSKEGNKYIFCTAGWSGNESLI